MKAMDDINYVIEKMNELYNLENKKHYWIDDIYEFTEYTYISTVWKEELYYVDQQLCDVINLEFNNNGRKIKLMYVPMHLIPDVKED